MLVFRNKGQLYATALANCDLEIELLTECLSQYLDGYSFKESFINRVLNPKFEVFSTGPVDSLDQVFSTLGQIILFDFDKNEAKNRKNKKLQEIAITHKGLFEIYAFVTRGFIHCRTINFALDREYLVIDQVDCNKYVNNHWFQNTLTFRPFVMSSKPLEINFCLSCGTFTCECTVEQDLIYSKNTTHF